MPEKNAPDTLIQRGREASAECGYCDLGLDFPFSCNCFKGDSRQVIAQLTDALETDRKRLAAVDAVARAAESLEGNPKFDRGERTEEAVQTARWLILRAIYDPAEAGSLLKHWTDVDPATRAALEVLAVKR